MSKIIFLWLALFISSAHVISAQQSGSSQNLLKERLEWFQDMKFGFFVHWGPFALGNMTSSWGMSLDLPQVHTENWKYDINVYRDTYFKLNRIFYPMEFDPTEWAQVAKEAGMKYFVMTTKHHDGFAMFDTKWTDYKITGPECPYSAHPEPDVLSRAFEVFRREGFGIGEYYSKADWHSPFFWKPNTPALDRNVNYDVTQEPERWQRFVEFTHGQIQELMTSYGRVDILWLDSGWIRPLNRHQDIQMERMVEMARGYQPWLIVVDRSVSGQYENYKTPEQEVPDKPIDGPWETCMTMAENWEFQPYENYKSARSLIHILVDIVSKGGNFLLNVGPMPNGKLPPPAVERMKEIGAWMKINGEAIYGTRKIAPYKEEEFRFTQKGDYVYAIYCGETKDDNNIQDRIPGRIVLKSFTPAPGSDVHFLGVNKPLTWRQSNAGTEIEIPASVIKSPPCKYACTFRIKI